MTRADSRPSAGILPSRTASADPRESNAAADASRRASGTHSVFAQEVCRVTVLARSTQVDMALPVDVPVSLLVPGIVDMIAGVEPAERPATGHRGQSDGDPAAEGLPVAWTLARIGFPPLAPTETLAELSVRDGELLVLGVAERPAPIPLFDDLM